MAITVNSRIGIPHINFSPGFYKTAYKQYRNGIFREVIEMMNRAETDSHVAGCLVGRKAGFQREFAFMPFSDENADQERAEQIDNIIRQLDYRQLFKDIQEARLKKYSVIDFEWEIVNNLQVPVKHIKLEHKFFRYDPKDGQLKIDFGKNLVDIPDEALVCQTAEMPILLPVLRDYILKEFGLESWAGFIETFGEGIILGKYPPGADAKFKEELETAVKDIARSARGIMPDGGTIDVVETSRTTGDHEKFVDAADRGISISILGHQNAVAQSKGLQVGENLTQYKVKREIAVDDMFFIDSYVQQIVRMLIDRNWGDARYPVFELDKSEPIALKDRLDLLDLAFSHGLQISPDEYRKAGLYVYPDQEPIKKDSPF